MKAKVFNEEKLIREKMKTMARLHDTKVLPSFFSIVALMQTFSFFYLEKVLCNIFDRFTKKKTERFHK